MLSKLIKPLALPLQLQWEYAHEPTLMEWTIRARNYNAFAANAACLILGVIFFVFLYAMKREDESVCSLAVMYFLGMGFAYSMFHQRMNTAYRITRSGVECCEWKDFPKWMLTFANWFAGISAVICIWLASTNPMFLLGALVGPGGAGLMYLTMANSKSYQESQSEYHHYKVMWSEVAQLAIASYREVVDLQYCLVLKDSKCVRYWNLNIFCRHKEKKEVAELIKPHLLPGVPCITARVKIPR